MTVNDISYQIRGAIFNVYNTLGPGLPVNFNTDHIEKNILRIANLRGQPRPPCVADIPRT